MLSTSERKKIKFTKSLFGTDTKKYDELYQQFCREGYTKELSDSYAEAFVDNIKKPAADDVIQAAKLYRKIFDYKNAQFYLEMLADKKLGTDDRYAYCLEMLRITSSLGQWRDAEDFRTENVSFIQTYMAKKKLLNEDVEMYISLALPDIAAKRYDEAFRLINFGYKPKGRNDERLLSIFIAAVYLNYFSGDEESLGAAVENANCCLKLFNTFSFEWSKADFENRILKASEGKI